ncbi:translation initiation factor IF-2 [Acrasis kona]|uniref:Translation initiation factor IF-2 n=1 Tax=Acrasis kona TaxID=1008807 RepID=A0AAW2Z8H8_9EUKA
MRDALFDTWTDAVAPFEYNLMQATMEDIKEDAVDIASIQETTVMDMFENTAPDTSTIMKMFEGTTPLCQEQALLDMDFYGDLAVLDHSSNSSETSSPCPLSSPDTNLADSSEASDQDSPTKTKKPKASNKLSAVKATVRSENPLFHFAPHHEDEFMRLEAHSEPIIAKSKPLKPAAKKPVKAKIIKSTLLETPGLPSLGAVSAEVLSPKSKVQKKKKTQTAAVVRKVAAAIVSQQKAPICPQEYINPPVLLSQPEASDVDAQRSCCIHGCTNTVTNRLRFSLRRISSFKNDFITNSWNKICSYHYFNDLYQHKKANSVQ